MAGREPTPGPEPSERPDPQPMAWTPERVQRFWDYESRHPERYYSYKYGEQIIDRAVRLLDLGRSGGAQTTWLDYGCGYGSFSELLMERGFGVVIHDLSPESLAACARRCGDHPNFRGTLESCDAPIDVISLLEVVEHVEPETLVEIVASLRRSCRAGARLVITTPNREDLNHPDSTVYCPQCDTIRHRWQHLRSFTAESLARELADLGLRGVRVREEDFRRDKRLRTRNPLRKLKRVLCDARLRRGDRRPNLLAVAEL